MLNNVSEAEEKHMSNIQQTDSVLFAPLFLLKNPVLYNVL